VQRKSVKWRYSLQAATLSLAMTSLLTFSRTKEATNSRSKLPIANDLKSSRNRSKLVLNWWVVAFKPKFEKLKGATNLS